MNVPSPGMYGRFAAGSLKLTGFEPETLKCKIYVT